MEGKIINLLLQKALKIHRGGFTLRWVITTVYSLKSEFQTYIHHLESI